MAPGATLQIPRRDSDEEGNGRDYDPAPETSSSSSNGGRRKRKHRKRKKKQVRNLSSNDSDPNNSVVAVRVTTPTNQPRPAKISAKLVDIRQFDGAIAPGYIDSGAGDWLMLLQDQMEMAQLMTGETWTDGVKLSILVRHLRGEAEAWYRDYSSALRTIPFSEVCNSFLEAHRCPLNSQQILDHVSRARKRPDETYKGYARRLRSMAANVNDGKASEGTDRQAFITFFKYTKAKLGTDLVTKYRRLDAVKNPWNETLDLSEMLAEHFGGDGRIQPGNLNRSDIPTNGKRTREETATNNPKEEDQRSRKRTQWTNPGNRERNQQGGRRFNPQNNGSARRVEVVEAPEEKAHPPTTEDESKTDAAKPENY